MGVKGSDTSVYVLLYMLDGGEIEATGSAAVFAADCGMTMGSATVNFMRNFQALSKSVEFHPCASAQGRDDTATQLSFFVRHWHSASSTRAPASE